MSDFTEYKPDFSLHVSSVSRSEATDTEKSADTPMTDRDRLHLGCSRMEPEQIADHPISQAAAYEICQHYVGLGSARRRPEYFLKRRDAWWDRLRNSETPEERLTCERMINAVNEAMGLHYHERGAVLKERNRKRLQADEIRIEQAAEEAAEAAAIARWR